MGSWEPMATIVPSISGRLRSSEMSTSSPAWWPSTSVGMTSSPSARTSEVSTPAPRGSGEATSPSPTRPSRTRTQSSEPITETTLRASRARVWGRGVATAPSSSASSGAAKMSKVSDAETG